MSADFNSLSSQAMSLPPEQRFELAQRLWESVEGQLDEEDEELFREIDRRIAQIDAGTAEVIPYDQAMREIRERLNESRNPSAGPT